jgi:fatty acid synthase
MGLQDCILGLEFSGRDENGNRVMGMIPSKALATTLVVDENDFLWPIPSNWSMEEASTIPVAYATAYYALIIRGKLKRRESVLIHSGSGGVGQAAIAICLSLECQIFITVGSDAKRDFLKKEFPKLCDYNFSSSRDINFESHIMKETDGRGVDIVLNSLSEDKLQASLRCLATNGRFLEIGKFDMSQNNSLGLLSASLNLWKKIP